MSETVEMSDKQRSIVLADDGPIYVKASAGSGKTRVLTERIRKLLARSNKKVLALTFTNKAGQEILERLSDIDEIEKRTFIGTFHGFCQSILENHGSLIGYEKMPHIFEDDSDRLELIELAIEQVPTYLANYKQKDKKEQKDYCWRALNFISEVKRKLINENDISEHTEDENIILLFATYQDILRSQNAIDFDDLLLRAYNLFLDAPSIAALYRRSFAAICVDEAQDLNNAQYQFLKALAGDEFKNIMMVGDPNQSIFHFNGSSPDYMDKDFVKDFSPVIISLTENYRSSISVLDAAKKIFPDAEYIEGTVKKGIFELLCAADENIEADWVVNKISSVVTLKKHDDIEGEITFEKIAVLARNRYLFKSVEEKLKNKSIPYYYKMTPGAVKFESKLMQLFDLAMRVKLNPKDDLHLQHLRKIIGIKDVDGNGLFALEKIASDDDHKRIINMVISINEDGSNLKSELIKYRQNLVIEDENETNMLCNDIDELLVHWMNYAKKTDNKSLHQFKNAMALGQTHSISQHNGVTLSTIHTVKGQEYDIVFIIGMDDETFPDYRAVKSGGVDLKQEKNNLYVAFTRSKRWLYVTWPRNRTMPWGDSKSRRISRFLTDFEYSTISDI